MLIIIVFMNFYLHVKESFSEPINLFVEYRKTSICPLYLPSVLCRYSSPLSLLSCFFFSCIFNCDAHFFASALQPFLIRWHLHKYLQLRCSCFLFFAFVYSACIFMYHIYWDFLYILSNEFCLRKAREYFGHFCVKILKHLRFFLFK